MTPFLIFDAYGTLVELDDFYHRLQRSFAARGVDLPLEVVRCAAHREMRHYMGHTIQVRDHASWLALRRDCAGVLADAIREQGHALTLAPDDILHVLTDALVFYVFPEALEALQVLREAGIPMAVLSNWDYELGLVLRSLQLDGFFEFILTSAEIGTEKPDPRFFECGLERARAVHPGLAARDCYYIGDHYEKDVLPARAAGLTPIWLIRDRRDLASGDTHDAADEVVRIGSLKELAAHPMLEYILRHHNEKR